MSSTTAATTRFRRRIYQGEPDWNWAALYTGCVQPRGYRTYRRSRWLWQFHLTPVHVHRDNASWEAGLCWGRRTVYVLRHR